ncbi:hypothetical protein [Campylobacter coli]|uniref:hypothetical protein n=1 Tax=Campylobacter coli TaxID=195 RepID=UPI0009305034|nr:hypothetical protein [Campylobacter coli]
MDAIAHCKGKIIIREAKSSKDAPLTQNQIKAFNLISQKNNDITIELRGNKVLKYDNKMLKKGDKILSKNVTIKISRPSGITTYKSTKEFQ